MVEIAPLVNDLRDESADLDGLVADLAPADWARSTPSPGWTIAHQIAHLGWTDSVALLAIEDPDAFAVGLAAAAASPDSFVDEGSASFMDGPDPLLDRWRTGRDKLADTLATTQQERILWYGTTMSPASMVTARIMETWAHGLDVADALGLIRQPTARLRHIAHLGFRTLGWGFAAHGRPMPTSPVRLELSGPDSALWTFGPADATDRVTGPALDFCLLVTQRRHPEDLALVATGPVATEWLSVAQVFAGPPGAGRPPGSGIAASHGEVDG